MTAQMLADRAAKLRANHRSIVVGAFAAEAATLYVAFALAPPSSNIGFWLYIAAMQVVVFAALLLIVAETRIRPSDAELVERWIPFAEIFGHGFSLLLLVSPWVMLPLATPGLRIALYLIYTWALMLSLLSAPPLEWRFNPVLYGLPVSLAAALIVYELPLAVPLAGFFIVAGATLAFFDWQKHKDNPGPPLRSAQTDNNQVPSFAGVEDAVMPGLTNRQVEVLGHVARGLTNKEIARELGISPATVKVHVAQILAATGAANRAAAALALARSDGADRARPQ